GDFEGSLALARQALKPAAQGHEDIVVARALNLIAHVRGIKQLQFKEMLELRPYWETIVERHGGDREQVEMLSILGSILDDAEQYDEALRVLERARTLADKTFGPDSLLLTGVLNSLGVLYGNMGRFEEARATHQRVLAIRNKMLGAEHPFVGTTLNNIGLVFYDEGRHTESFDYLERAIAVRRKALGKEHFEVAVALFNAGRNLWYLARYADAQAYFDEARAIFEKTRGRSEVYIGNYHIGTADLLIDQGKPAEAREHFLKARAIFERTIPNSIFEVDRGLGVAFFEQGRYAEAKAVQQPLVEKIFKKQGDDDQFLAARRVELARTLMRLGDLDTAEGLLEKARAAMEKEVGPKASQVSFPLFAQGELHLLRKQLALAITTLESALLLAPPKLRPHVELALAQALQQAGKDRERAGTLAREARDFYKRIGNQPKAAGAERWVAGNAGP
ncbi:MAG TPA: tetratricopeptide repeat protein, partial [Longimicrobium sp.]|nr:tetratricopeptide repeat protein [Longimicrobium sp.]